MAETTTQRAAARVRRLRGERGWSIAELSRRMDGYETSGIPAQILSKIENGTRKYLSVDELEALCNAFDVSPNDLMGWKNGKR